MGSSRVRRPKSKRSAEAAASWYYSCATPFSLILLILLAFSKQNNNSVTFMNTEEEVEAEKSVRGSNKLADRPCDEIYVVGEGETLNSISEKCGDPFIVEQNPHIHDPDDLFPGLVIKITPLASKFVI
ncbi:hypothetical protein LguiB_003597 [Lonicera macranthoides]